MSKIDKKLEEILIDPKSPNGSLCCSWEQIVRLKSLFAEFGKELIEKSKPKGFTSSDESLEIVVEALLDQYEYNMRQKLKALLGEGKE